MPLTLPMIVMLSLLAAFAAMMAFSMTPVGKRIQSTPVFNSSLIAVTMALSAASFWVLCTVDLPAVSCV